MTSTLTSNPQPPNPAGRPAAPVPALLKPGTAYADAWRRCVAAVPEALRDDRVLNLWGTAWRPDGRTLPATTPVDGTPIAGAPRLDGATAQQAVRAALDQHRAWRQVPLPERRARITATLDARRTLRAARPAAGLGDRQALAAGSSGRRPGDRGRALVRRGHRAHARRPGTAGRTRVQHRQLEIR